MNEVLTQRLMDFYSAMCAWEIRTAALFKDRRAGRVSYDEFVKRVTNDRNEICSKFCRTGAWDIDDRAFAEPPEYDPKRQTVLSCNMSETSAEVIVQKDNYSAHLKYELILTDGQWMIARRSCFLGGAFKESLI